MRLIKLNPLLLLLILTALSISVPARAETVRDVVYGHKDGMAMVMDVYKPTTPNGAGVAYMISGGWMSSPEMQRAFESMFVPLVDAGYTVFAVQHGSSPRYFVPDAWNDEYKGFQYIGEHASDYGVDPNRLGVSGISAGGHLSLMLGLFSDANTKYRPKAVVAYMPPVDIRLMVGPSKSFPALNFDPAQAESVSPITLVSSDDPPTLLVHGDADELVPIANSERMHAALKAAGVKTEFVVIPGAPHGLFQGEGGKTAAKALLGWFDANL
jgi:acetyl esterase/lipase